MPKKENILETIWKFPFQVTDTVKLQVPEGAQFLSIQVQGGVPCLWAKVDPSMPKRSMKLGIYGTGHSHSEIPGTFLATFQMDGGSLVFHAFLQSGSRESEQTTPLWRGTFLSPDPFLTLYKIIANSIDELIFICYNVYAFFVKVMLQTYKRDRTRSRSLSTEWVQALTTLGVLILIFSAIQGSPVDYKTEKKVASTTESYWNEQLGYGFSKESSHLLTKLESTDASEAITLKKDSPPDSPSLVRVSYYKDTPLEKVKQDGLQNVATSYAALPGGVAVIQGDLTSASAHLVLSTLHSR